MFSSSLSEARMRHMQSSSDQVVVTQLNGRRYVRCSCRSIGCFMGCSIPETTPRTIDATRHNASITGQSPHSSWTQSSPMVSVACLRHRQHLRWQRHPRQHPCHRHGRPNELGATCRQSGLSLPRPGRSGPSARRHPGRPARPPPGAAPPAPRPYIGRLHENAQLPRSPRPTAKQIRPSSSARIRRRHPIPATSAHCQTGRRKLG
mmetsp:Transcript_37555/g.107763  ORF Transcript_37555/g.107763 Transcript_37555/m.107763 type:complete len:205 (-) Transcript_37555:1606-2220(-)